MAAAHLLYRRQGEVIYSPWLTIDQEMIDRFADATIDHQFIHIDPVRAADSPFGGTVVHGLLTLSLLPHLRELTPEFQGQEKLIVNIGFDRVRFVSPVRSGAMVRARWSRVSVDEKAPGTFQCTDDVTVEIEGEPKPAMVATWVTRSIF